MINLILMPNFKLDTLLPNYTIIQKLYTNEKTIRTNNDEDVFDSIFNLTIAAFEHTIKWYIQSCKRDRVPKKHKIQSQVSRLIKEWMVAWVGDSRLRVIRDVIEKQLVVDV